MRRLDSVAPIGLHALTQYLKNIDLRLKVFDTLNLSLGERSLSSAKTLEEFTTALSNTIIERVGCRPHAQHAHNRSGSAG